MDKQITLFGDGFELTIEFSSLAGCCVFRLTALDENNRELHKVEVCPTSVELKNIIEALQFVLPEDEEDE